MAQDTTQKTLSRLGRHFLVGLSGPELLSEEADLLSRLQPLGIILFAKNIRGTSASWKEDLHDLISRAREAAKRSPFLVSIDHEGGRVHRFPPPVTKFPAAKNWGDLCYEITAAMAKELRALGFNLSFAPVADIHSEPLNTVIGDRAFGHTPEAISGTAERVMNALHDHGVLSCGKHFPGHGDTIQDSHYELPVLDLSRKRLEERELLPFRHLISAGIPLIMTAHVRYPAFDMQEPASLSRNVIEILLRNELGFRGAVVTDDLEMKALGNYSMHERALRAMQAGSDILLEANRKDGLALEHACQMAESLADAEQKGSLRLQDSQQRIGHLLDFVAKLEQIPSPQLAVVGCAEHSELLAEVTSRCSA